MTRPYVGDLYMYKGGGGIAALSSVVVLDILDAMLRYGKQCANEFVAK